MEGVLQCCPVPEYQYQPGLGLGSALRANSVGTKTLVLECFSAADQTAADVWPAPACVHCSTAAPARYLHTAWLARLEILAIKSELHNVISQICGEG